MLFYGAALVACPAVADETTILFNVTIAYILYFYVCLMYNKANNEYTTVASIWIHIPTRLRSSSTVARCPVFDRTVRFFGDLSG